MEKKHVWLLAIIGWQKPNLLLLDEPTNHLDLDMRHALTLALQSFEGAMILISHDRNLIRSTTDELFLVHDGRMDPYNGDLDDYSDWLIQQRNQERNESKGDRKTDVNSAQLKKEQKRQEAERRKALRPLKLKIEKLEKNIETMQEQLSEVENALSDPAIYSESEKDNLKVLLTKQTDCKKQLVELEDTWMSLLEDLEEKEAS